MNGLKCDLACGLLSWGGVYNFVKPVVSDIASVWPPVVKAAQQNQAFWLWPFLPV